MDLETVRKLIKKYIPTHEIFAAQARTAQRYYRCDNDILHTMRKEEENPLRNADNKIPSNFHGLLVDQKAAYMFTSPPLFDVGDKDANEAVRNILGRRYPRICSRLAVNASNTGVAWLHYWENDGFKYDVIDSEQVIPVWGDTLERELMACFRTYQELDDDGVSYHVYELWTDKECSVYRKKINDGFERLEMYNMFDLCGVDADKGNVYAHNFGRVPFIPFFNNGYHYDDLRPIKGLIDTYDKTYSGFINDLEDIQEIIFILSGYEGESLADFLHQLKKYKTIKIDSEDGTGGGLSTLTIDIPVEAREKMLKMTRKSIFEQGKGIDPDPQNFGNSSGAALKYLYSLLDLKAGMTEMEFRNGFEDLILAICDYANIPCKRIIQTWTRTSVTNDTELADIAQKSVGIVSNRTILERHPFVEDADEELNRLAEENDGADDYSGLMNRANNGSGDNSEE